MSLDNFPPVDNTDGIVVATPLGNSITNVPHGDSSFFSEFYTPIQHLDLLKKRGLSVKGIYEEERFLRLLHSVGYYRLSQYFKHFYNPAVPKEFLSDTKATHIISAYKQNERLRSLLIDALLKIESKLLVLLVENGILHTDDIYWCYDSKFSPLNLIATACEAKIRDEIVVYKQPSTRLFYEQYPGHSKPPSWVIMQSQNFGTICQLLQPKFLPKRVLNPIVLGFQIPEKFNYKDLYRIFNALRYLRNLCAHHEKLLGETLRIAPPLWDELPLTLVHRLPNYLKWIEHLLISITPRDSFKNELCEVIKIVNRDCPASLHILFHFSDEFDTLSKQE